MHQLDILLSDYPIAPRHATIHNHPLGRSPVGVFGTPALCESYTLPADLGRAPFLLLPRTASLRRSLDHELHTQGTEVRVVVESQDSALLKVFAARGHGFIVAPRLITEHLESSFGLIHKWELPRAAEDLYLLSMERHVKHPAAQRIVESARTALASL